MPLKLRVTMADEPKDIKVAADGSTIRLAQDKDLAHFNLRSRHHYGGNRGEGMTWDVWNAVYQMFEHHYPSEVHFSDHPVFNEARVGLQMVSRPRKAWLVEHEVNPNAYHSRRFRNPWPIPTQEEVDRGVNNVHVYKADMSESVGTTIGRVETHEFSWGLSATVSYEVGGDAAGYKVGVSATASIGGSDSVEESASHYTAQEIHAGVDVPLGPGQEALATLMAGTGTLKVGVQFENVLTGEVGINFHKVKKPGWAQAWNFVPIEKFLQHVSGVPDHGIGKFGHLLSEEVYSIGFVTDGDVSVEPIPAEETEGAE